MKRMAFLAGMAALLTVVVAHPPAFAEEDAPRKYIYQWVDDRGNAHIVDSLEKVPRKYRSSTMVIDQGPAEHSGSEGSGPSAQESGPQPSGDEQVVKSEWQERLRTAKRRQASVEERYRQLERRRDELQAQWGSAGAALPPQEALAEIAQLTGDMENAQKEIESYRHEIEVVIPDEARRAGIPPGWLREVE